MTRADWEHKMTFYGIRNIETKIRILVSIIETKIPVGFYASSNDGDRFAVSVEYSFDYITPDNVWLVNSRRKAEHALVVDTKWHSAGYETPSHDGMNIAEFEVFEVNI